MFSTILIANRGEIALRVLRTCQELGIRTVVVYSAADRDSPAVALADQAVLIGPPSAKDSYLNIPAVIEAALATGAEAVHPGYGFLSEDPYFSEICEKNGLVFIGPPSDVIAMLGDKARARAVMSDAGLPVFPGSRHTLDNAGEALATAIEIGFPVIIKAAAGGGGRGMGVVHRRSDFMRVYADTRAHAQAIFGDSRVYIERFCETARHVEIQILCDAYGNGVHLGERDCSVQRRHQKLIEETPSPGLPTELTARMGADAVRGALAAGYVGAGTMEFIVDQDGSYHFMEINCRIQVEHPVTEMVTGLDLVREQLLVASGEPLSLRQEDLVPSGVAVECRINAENPSRGFMPTPGQLTSFVPPGGPFVRVDSHAFTGYRIGPDYDSLLAKIITWAPDRDQALARMDRALAEMRVEGARVHTTRPLLREILAHPLFRDAKHTTSLVDQMLGDGVTR
ncbi:acetyl-CoA carboxylase biotin carboxylase subunit [Actinomadura barringtoniae]|uniref:biotin carboxylase n=1 Tax=Actinomadura barringtoniae TaxID=1427535 RepID=A0A939PA94_9ACTN|nr:acetyl-CoA carboxylase biotin carboxylase subunit [Actinomadura barringtoniae]MBO2445579.1 acetyl-CoA carboxylase biotin carboxylase subunit [Actinomadura barringtoniae]